MVWFRPLRNWGFRMVAPNFLPASGPGSTLIFWEWSLLEFSQKMMMLRIVLESEEWLVGR